MTHAVWNLWKAIFFHWNKAAEKRLHENKNSWEMLISTVYVIKYYLKVENLLLYTKDIYWKLKTTIIC